MTDLHEIPLPGLDGANPLGFLAALGTWRTTEAIHPGTRMYWKPINGHWAPVLLNPQSLSEETLAKVLHVELIQMKDHSVFSFANNLNLKPHEFAAQAEQAIEWFFDKNDIISVAFLSAFGSSAITNEDGAIEDTALRTMSGAGNQHFLKTFRALIDAATETHLEKCLFKEWMYDDPLESMGLRWDPGEDIRRALRWRNPSGDPERKKALGMWGANRLAIEALPLLPTAPVGSHLETTGFKGYKSNNTFFVWPLWDVPIGLDTGRSLLALEDLQTGDPNSRNLRACGIPAVFRSQRITNEKFRNFTSAVQID